jgi:predicted peptidase
MRYILLIAFAANMLAAPKETGFLNRVIKVDNTDYRYQVFLPAGYTKDKPWPVILFLHGAGERGDDGIVQTDTGLGHAIRLHRERFPAVVIMPQCRKNVWWTDPAMEKQVMAILAKSMKEFRGDPKRLYLTGLSMGGYGTFALAAKYPDKFAAAVPICGGVVMPRTQPVGDPYSIVAGKIGKTPMWIFHGAADPTVPVTESQKMNAAIKAAGGNVRYTEYPGVLHNSWDKAYGEADLAKWLFEQRLP